MGEHHINPNTDENEFRAFMQAILDDIKALELMLERGMITDTATRIGAEQEFFLVDENGTPASKAMDVLEHLDDDRFTTEIAQFNLEANLTPRSLTGRCFWELEQELSEVVALAHQAASAVDADVIMAGILPTLNLSHLGLENMTPSPRYFELNKIITRSRGGDFQVALSGVDDIHLTHNNVLLESCNNSFQVHLQVTPESFVNLYNTAQALAGPVLAAATNSPILVGKRLWHETRIALFQHSVDERSALRQQRGHRSRVDFGDDWVHHSVADLFKEDLAEFRVLITKSFDENGVALVEAGQVPQLKSMCLHSGTIWRWNRACYGVANGQAHLRIETRFLPAGPTIVDEVANAAFFMGLMKAFPETYGDVRQHLRFEDIKHNFFSAAQHGLMAQQNWLDGTHMPAAQLILEQLIPLAHQGLEALGVDTMDRDRYLGIIQDRVRCGQTGAQWMLGSLESMAQQKECAQEHKIRTLVCALKERQEAGEPVHTWSLAQLAETRDWRQSYQTVGQFMKTHLFTVHPKDLISLATHLMDWKHIGHIPVEDENGRLVGILTHTDLVHLMADDPGSPVTVESVMKTNPVTVSPSTPTRTAIDLLRHHHIGCLPVVDQDQLVGMITAKDFLEVSAFLFDELQAQTTPQSSPLSSA